MGRTQIDGYTPVLGYHDRTKHHPDRYARSLGYMDWANQPNPFRFYEGAPRIHLALMDKDRMTPYPGLYGGAGTEKSALDISTIARLLELSLGLSAWKQYGASEWSLRMNPSSGNLHPTECYLLLPRLHGRPACIAHYNPLLHCLEILCELGETDAGALEKLQGFGLILSSIPWREAWKYGERAFRYCNHDLGHALAALRYASNLAGWELAPQPQVGDGALDRLLGFDRIAWPPEEAEHTDCLCWVSRDKPDSTAVAEWLHNLPAPAYPHAPNCLSADHAPWPVIRAVTQATRSPGFPPPTAAPMAPAIRAASRFSAEQIIRKRRSAQAYDPATSRLGCDDLVRILERTLPAGLAPFDRFCQEPAVHLVLFVHRVDGLDPGLYLLLRNQAHLETLRSHLDERFAWRAVAGDLPLFLLETGDFRARAQIISCQQSIGGDSAFSLGMLARFQPVLEAAPWLYPRLYWETGFIGQVLYLEAEAIGLRGTGIGCFFDDMMHELLGVEDHYWQDLYHFTIGMPTEDSRIQTKPPYHHLAAFRGMAENR